MEETVDRHEEAGKEKEQTLANMVRWPTKDLLQIKKTLIAANKVAANFK